VGLASLIRTQPVKKNAAAQSLQRLLWRWDAKSPVFGKLLMIDRSGNTMFEDFLVVTILVAVFWLGAYGYYVYTSRQQQDIISEIESLKEKLGPDEEMDAEI
jgi:hypothetical protein